MEWCICSKSRTSNLSPDIEMQERHPPEISGPTTEGYNITAWQYLLGLSEEQIRPWSGRLAYCRYLEGCFEPLLADEYAVVWTAIGIQRPQTAADCWPFFNTVCTTARLLQVENISIADIWDQMRNSPRGHHQEESTAVEKAACHIAVFSVLCWGTMTLRPRLNWADVQSIPSLMVNQQQPDQPGLKMDLVRRPIPAIFKHFQSTMPTGRWQHPISAIDSFESTILHVSSLNYSSLKVIGKIRLTWVDSLSDHLDFDFANRRLSIFKFPSFCALKTLEESSEPPVFLGLVHALYNSEHKAQIHQEVLMSYRLIFGQTRDSRLLAQNEIRKLKTQQSGDLHDQLLDLLCGRPCDSKFVHVPLSFWPITCRSFEGSLQEEHTYSSQDDFPMLGRRLAKLQEFSVRQRPSELRDLWRDRRDPLQWYTFWAVLIFGGSSLLLAILQLVVGVLQVIIAYRTPAAEATTPPPPVFCKC